jgi:hypothetical protein
MNTRSQNAAQKFSVAEVEAAKALLQLKKAIKTGFAREAKWPSGRPRRSTAGNVDYREQD